MTVGFVFGGVARRVIRGARDAKPLKEITETNLKTNKTNQKSKRNTNLRERDAICIFKLSKRINGQKR